MVKLVISAAIGLVSGTLSGAFGIGGAVLSTPAIRLLLRTPALIAVGTTLPAIIPTTISGLAAYARAHLIDLRLAAIAASAGAVFSIAGAYATTYVRGEALLLLTAVLIVVLAARMLRQRPPQRPPRLKPGVGLFLVTGAVSGFVAGLLGVGGGIILVPVFTGLLRLPIKTAVGTSLAVVSAQAIPGTIAHTLLGNIDWVIVAGLAAGAVPGALVGSRLAVAAADKTLRVVVGIGMLVLAVLFAGSELRILLQ